MYAAQIQTGELRPQDLPTTYGDWSDYARFAVTFAPRDREGCREFATSAFARRSSRASSRATGRSS